MAIQNNAREKHVSPVTSIRVGKRWKLPLKKDYETNKRKSIDKKIKVNKMIKISDKSDVAALFPKSIDEINALVEKSMHDANEDIKAIISTPKEKRTFANTVKKLDKLFALSTIAITSHILNELEMLHPNEKMRNAAHAGIIKLQDFMVDNISNNKKIYKALKEYTTANMKNETLTDEQAYFVTETLSDFKKAGLDLPEEKLEEVRKLNKELAALELSFETNIALDNTKIEVSKNELKGLDDDFINSLEQTKDGLYLLGLDYPTLFNIIDNCEIEETRKKLYIAFNNRAYPKNEALLKQIIAKRDELAKALGFASFAQLDIDGEMAKTPETVEQFLQELLTKANIKEQKEFEELTAALPESVTLTKDGKLKTWDYRFVNNQYKKKHFTIDENEIAQYFPTDHTIEQLLSIYEQFLGITFKETSIDNLWHEEVKVFEVCEKGNTQPLGYLLLDLYPRPNKYGHACQSTTFPAATGQGPAVALVVANFPKATPTKPALLKRNDVETFFHELGHALHAILGRTNMASFSGTNVMTDFVEMPSQMLEEWMTDKEIITMISKHYKTGKALPNEIIDNILALKKFDTGNFLQRQIFLSLLSLNYFKEGTKKDPKTIYDTLTAKIRPNIYRDPQDHMFASFGHLSGYGALYYSYMWSKVFALDMFNEIKKVGLLNPEIGRRYIAQVISKGASQDPNVLLETFLGRQPNQHAFCEILGLE